MEFIKNKHQQIVFLTLSSIGVIVGFLMNYFWFLADEIGGPLLVLSLPFMVFSLAYILLPNRFWRLWRTFSLLFALFSVIILASIDIQASSWGPEPIPFDRRIASHILAYTYSLITLGLIAHKFIAERLKRKRSNTL